MVTLNENKTGIVGNPTVFITDQEEARWGVWFANGDRVITSTPFAEPLPSFIEVYPNPLKNMVFVDVKEDKDTQIELFHASGQLLSKYATKGTQRLGILTEGLPDGVILMKIYTKEGIYTKKLMKF